MPPADFVERIAKPFHGVCDDAAGMRKVAFAKHFGDRFVPDELASPIVEVIEQDDAPRRELLPYNPWHYQRGAIEDWCSHCFSSENGRVGVPDHSDYTYYGSRFPV